MLVFHASLHRVTCLQRVDAAVSTQTETAAHLPHVDDDVELMRLGMLALSF